LTSESVSEGHPDKVADQISDSVVDYVLARDPNARVACETLIGPGYLVLAGEIGTRAVSLDTLRAALPDVARQTLRQIGYVSEESGFDTDQAEIHFRIGLQSPEINDQVDRQDGAIGAGDQGLMFGYACDETDAHMPLPIAMAHELLRELTSVRKNGSISWLLPDAKSQVTAKYQDDVPVGIETVVIASQHKRDVSLDELRTVLHREVVTPVLARFGYDASSVNVLINHAGSFVLGGPAADTGLTGRKIIVDTYGGSCPHGGGAFSGKDPSKVDRSAAYAARWVARHVVAGKWARRAQVQLAYAIGSLQPVSIRVDTMGTGSVPDAVLAAAVGEVFDLSPRGIIDSLALRQPRYRATAHLGHFGRHEDGFTWEQTTELDAFGQAVVACYPQASTL
jgi:S-adenosylmethionine synthetase